MRLGGGSQLVVESAMDALAEQVEVVFAHRASPRGRRREEGPWGGAGSPARAAGKRRMGTAIITNPLAGYVGRRRLVGRGTRC